VPRPVPVEMRASDPAESRACCQAALGGTHDDTLGV
jgi:hypothetical protein